jgi:phytoene dehydrogenase-like protein
MKKNKKSIIIIGAGLSGLSAGCYAQMNGFDCTILETHNIPGGACTSWNRGDYTFDWCILWLLGSGPGNDMNQIWQELGALNGKKIFDPDVMNHVKGTDGRMVKFYVDPDKLESHLKQISPVDGPRIEFFCRDLKKFTKLIPLYPFLKPMPLMGLFEKLKMQFGFLTNMKFILRTVNTPITDFAKGFKDPLLQEAFKYILFQQQLYFPLLPYYFNLGCATLKTAGCPEGGSLGLSRSIETRFLDLGGKIQYRKKVSKILIKNNKATGVLLEDGSKLSADIVISACDLKNTIYKMLDGEYTDQLVDKLYNELIDKPTVIFPGQVSVFLGVNRNMSAEPHTTTCLLTDQEASLLPAAMQKNIVIDIRSNRYTGQAPEGKAVISAWYFSDYDYWCQIHEDKEAYRIEKAKVLAFVLNYLEKMYPGIKNQIEQKDVSSPTTLTRYTDVYKGSVLGWNPFGEAEDLVEKMAKKHKMKLPGLKNFYLSGQWTTTVGGTIRAVSTGRHVMQFVCKDSKKKFTASISA